MEVHHHTHTERKKWTHYFWEFFMLFLAVTLGFFVENLREDLKNKKEIQSDMQSMVADLKSDVIYFDSVIMRNEYSCVMMDSLITQLNGDRANTSDIYYLARTVTANFGYFYLNVKTFEQMKSSGALKLITPRSLLDSIADYYTSIQWVTSQAELMLMKVDGIHQGNSQLFNSFIFQKMMHIDYGNFQHGVISIKRPDGNPALLTNDFNKINDVALRYHYLYTTMKFYDKTAEQMNQQAKRLIDLVQKEYHLK
jgi:hypothetical protein